MRKRNETEWEKSEGWEHIDISRGFSVVVKKRKKGEKSLWAIYTHIFPTHPLFPMFRNDDPFEPAARLLRAHGGFTGLEVAAEVISTSYCLDQPWDSRFANYETKTQAWEVFREAEERIALLEGLKDDGPLQMVKTLDGAVILARVIEEEGEENE